QSANGPTDSAAKWRVPANRLAGSSHVVVAKPGLVAHYAAAAAGAVDPGIAAAVAGAADLGIAVAVERVGLDVYAADPVAAAAAAERAVAGAADPAVAAAAVG